MRTLQENHNKVIDFFLRAGEILDPPALIMFTQNDQAQVVPILGEVAESWGSYQGRTSIVQAAGTTAALIIPDRVIHVFLYSEAWHASLPTGKERREMPASLEDWPDRIEVLIIGGCDQEGNGAMYQQPFHRDENDQIVLDGGPIEHEEGLVYKQPLLEHFWEGYNVAYQAKVGRLN